MYWWIYVLIFLSLFVVVLLGNLFLKKYNEARLEEQMARRRERLPVSVQTSFVLDKNTKRIDSKNLKEDKRTLKSYSLVFSSEKSITRTDLRELIAKNSRGNLLYDQAVKPSSNIETVASSLDAPYPSVELNAKSPVRIESQYSKSNTNLRKELSNMCLSINQNKPNAHSQLATLSTKSVKSLQKVNEEINIKDSVRDILPCDKSFDLYRSVASSKHNENKDKNNEEDVETKGSAKEILPPNNDDNKDKYNKVVVKSKDSANDLLSSQRYDNIEDQNYKENTNAKESAKDRLHDDNKNKYNQDIIRTTNSAKKILQSLKSEDNKDKYNEEVNMTKGSEKDILPILKHSEHKDKYSEEIITTKDSVKGISSILKHDEKKDKHTEEDITNKISEKEILPLKHVQNKDQHNEEVIITKDFAKDISPILKHNENKDKHNEKVIKTKVLEEEISLLTEHDDKEDKCAEESVKIFAKEILPSFNDNSIDKHNEEVIRMKEFLNGIILSLKIDEKVNKCNQSSKTHLTREPSSLFFGPINYPQCTPKEMLEPYENALSSDTIEGKYIGYDSETSTSKIKSITAKDSVENVTHSVSRVIFNPETKTSYIDDMQHTLISKPESVYSKIPITNSRLNELTNTKENVSKSASRVTFAKNTAVVITDSSSMIDNICVVTTHASAFVSESETISSKELDVESISNSDAPTSTDSNNNNTTENVTKSYFKRNYINESVTITNSIFRKNTDRTSNKCEDDPNSSQTSFSYKFHDQKAIFNSNLTERLSNVIKDEASTSRSNNFTDNSEVIVVNNKFCGDKLSKGNLETVTSGPKKDLELEDNVFQTMSLDKMGFKSAQENTHDDKNKAKHDNKHADK